MTILVLQIIIKQWDKSERSEQHCAERAALAERHLLAKETAFYAFDKQCVIDQQGDDLMGDRLKFSQIDANTVQIDRFNISLGNKTLIYNNPDDEAGKPRLLGCLENSFIQCKYQWRYRVYEGGFYYWLYEELILNAINVASFEEDIFLKTEPNRVVLD
jgi:hypothetical protein